jgi:hypothetical protein
MDLKKTARVAGLLYLIIVVTGLFSLMYVPSHIMVAGDAAATIRNILASERLFRMGIVVELLSHCIFLVLPFALYKLLSPVDKDAAVLMVALGVMIVPITFVNNISKLDALSLLSGADYLRALPAGDSQARVMLALKSYSNGILVSKVFWGLWLLPFGYLVFKSRFLPRVLGILLMLGCFGYLIDFVGRALLPGFGQTVIASVVGLPAAFGELGICLWLLIVGASEPKPIVA